MSMSDCLKCWETPCRCGYDYRDWSSESIEDLRAVLLKVKMINDMYPDITEEEFVIKMNDK